MDKRTLENRAKDNRSPGKAPGKSPAKGGGKKVKAKSAEEVAKRISAALSPRTRNRAFSHGALKIHLKSATGLLSADANGLSDPYVVIQCGPDKKQEKKSKIIKETLEPVWNEKWTIKGKLQDFLTTGLYLRVMDSDDADRATVDRMAKDDPIGDTTVSLEALKKDESADIDAPLSTQGAIQVCAAMHHRNLSSPAASFSSASAAPPCLLPPLSSFSPRP